MAVGAAGATVSGTLAVLPSAIAVIVTEPAATAVTSPAEFTVTSAGLELCHAMVRSESTFPSASSRVAVAVVVCPTDRADVPSDTETVATGTARTLIVALAFRPSAWTVMTVLPFVDPVTTPSSSTLAMASFDDRQLSFLPLMTRPASSNTTASSWVVSPGSTVLFVGVMLTASTDVLLTRTAAVDVTLSIVANNVTSPAVSAWTTPSSDTVAMAGSELAQWTSALATALVEAPFADVTLSWSNSPSMTLAALGRTWNGMRSAMTTMSAVSAAFPARATTRAVPRDTAVTRPSVATDAMLGSTLDQLTSRMTAAPC